jgi:hypothetical protein
MVPTLSIAVAIMRESAMEEFIPHFHEHRITIDSVQRTVAEQLGLKTARLSEKGNSRRVVVPRQIAMYLSRQLTGASYPQLGRCFGGRHHTTVIHAIEKIAEQRQSDKDLAAVLVSLLRTLCEETVPDDGHVCNPSECRGTQYPRPCPRGVLLPYGLRNIGGGAPKRSRYLGYARVGH